METTLNLNYKNILLEYSLMAHISKTRIIFVHFCGNKLKAMIMIMGPSEKCLIV